MCESIISKRKDAKSSKEDFCDEACSEWNTEIGATEQRSRRLNMLTEMWARTEKWLEMVKKNRLNFRISKTLPP